MGKFIELNDKGNSIISISGLRQVFEDYTGMLIVFQYDDGSVIRNNYLDRNSIRKDLLKIKSELIDG